MITEFSAEKEGVFIGSVAYLGLNCYFEYRVHKEISIAEILLGQNTVVYTTNNAEYSYMPKFLFSPEEDGIYLIKTIGEFDTFGYLYDEDGMLIKSNDDYGLDMNFGILYPMKADSVYIIAARLFITPMGSFDLIVQREADYDLTDSEAAGTYICNDNSDLEEITLNSNYSFIAKDALDNIYNGYFYTINNNMLYKLVADFPDKNYLILELDTFALTYIVIG
jgi:hypothetical protein